MFLKTFKLKSFSNFILSVFDLPWMITRLRIRHVENIFVGDDFSKVKLFDIAP